MILETLALATVGLAALPALMTLVNLILYRRPPAGDGPLPAVSVLIPARDEEGSILAAVESLLCQRGVDLEVVVMDDGSADKTARIVRELADRDARVRLETAPPLPSGWCGKQHACLALSRQARNPVLLFIDADVRLSRNGLRSIVAELKRSGADLISGIPYQKTDSLAERLVIPLVHFVLLGFLPILGMRMSKSPAFAAGCGQLIAVRREAYDAIGGHASIHASRHDGIALPRAFREAGLDTDLFDATPVATCHMYRGAREVWNGFAKNATEGMAGGFAILVWTALLFGGQVLPWLLLIPCAAAGGSALTFAVCAILLSWTTRFGLALLFRQSLSGALLHPVGVAMIVAIQWYARLREIAGGQIAWKGRVRGEA